MFFLLCKEKEKTENLSKNRNYKINIVKDNFGEKKYEIARPSCPKYNVEVLYSPQIAYPKEALSYGKPAIVIVSAKLDSNGKVTDVIVNKSSHPLFEKYAKKLAYEFKFSPLEVDGKTSTEWWITWTIKFEP